jgi:hypothetical protein
VKLAVIRQAEVVARIGADRAGALEALLEARVGRRADDLVQRLRARDQVELPRGALEVVVGAAAGEREGAQGGREQS